MAAGWPIVGAGMSKFGAFPGKSTRDLFVEAFQEMSASVDKGLDPEDIEALYIGNYSSDLFEGQGHTAPMMADWIGLTPRPATRVEDACASSGVALREGIIAIASGLYDIVLVGGIEKMTDLPTERVTDTLATASDILYEIPAGFTFPGFYAAMATAYMARYGATPETFMKVGIKNHNNGGLNPKAQFGTPIREVMAKKKAKAEAKGYPVPAWEDEMAFLARRPGQPGHLLADAAVRLLAHLGWRCRGPPRAGGPGALVHRQPPLRDRHRPGQRCGAARPGRADRALRRPAGRPTGLSDGRRPTPRISRSPKSMIVSPSRR